MAKCKLIPLLLLAISPMAFAQGSYNDGDHKFGYPYYLWLGTFTIEGYTTNPLSYMHDGGDNLSNGLKSKLPSQVSFKDHMDYRDAQVATSLWTGNTTFNNNDMVLFGGHGYSGGYSAWNGSVDFNGSWPSTWSFGGFTKWVFVDACQTLRQDPGYYRPVFNGIHAIYGFDSNGWDGWRSQDYWVCDVQWYYCAIWPGCCFPVKKTRWWYTSDKYTYFVNNWVSQNMSMWDAWRNATRQCVYEEHSYDHKVAVILLRGNAFNASTGAWVDYWSDADKYNNTYSDRIYPYNTATWTYTGMYKITQTFGTPHY